MSNEIQLKDAYEATECYSVDPLVGVRDNVISPIECAYLIELAKPHVSRAGVVLDEGYDKSDGRTGSNHWLKYDEDDVVRSVGQRISDIVGLPLAHAESMQIIHYGPEQEYRPHFDAFNLSLAKGQRAAKWGGQRLVTALVYLNTVEAGGATQFPKLGITVPPLPGRMVIFHNTTSDIGGPHPLSLHAGMPVEAGEKWAFNLWFRLHDVKEIFDAEQPRPTVQIGLNPSTVATAGPGALAGNGPEAKKEVQHVEAHFDATGTGSTDLTSTAPNRDANPVISSAETSAQASGPQRLTVFANRADTLWSRAVNNLQTRRNDFPALHVSYWDTYGNKQQPEPPTHWTGNVFQTASREVLNPLSDIARVAAQLSSQGLARLVPETFESIEAASVSGPKIDDLWFIRTRLRNTRDKALCVPTLILLAAALPAGRIIQKAVDQLALIDQHKFTTRVYLVVIGDAIFVYGDTLVFVHGTGYAPNDPNFAAQVDHLSYRETDSNIRLMPGSKTAHHEALASASLRLAADLKPLLSDLTSHCVSHCANGAFAILALDTLLTKACDLKLLRIHTFPNFVTTADIDAEVHVPLFEDVLRTLAGLAARKLQIITN